MISLLFVKCSKLTALYHLLGMPYSFFPMESGMREDVFNFLQGAGLCYISSPCKIYYRRLSILYTLFLLFEF